MPGLNAAQDKRIAGLGIAMPFELWNWADTAGAPREIMDQWRHRDIRADIQALCSFPVYLQNDATAACGAELVFGQTGNLRDFIYFYIGAFAGGGIVLNGRLYSGPTGNAGALGLDASPRRRRPPHPADRRRLAGDPGEGAEQHAASTPPISGHRPKGGPATGRIRRLVRTAGSALAYAIVAASVIDFEAAVIDGWMPRRPGAAGRRARTSIAGSTSKAADTSVREGTVGIHARALGGASLPLSERFLVGAAGAERA